MNITDDQLKQRNAVSDTPRTDAATKTYIWNGVKHIFVEADVVRQLERELAAVTAERDALKANLTNSQRLNGDLMGTNGRVIAERDEISLRREESVMANEQVLSDLSASQQEVARLRQALEKCIACLDWFAANKPDDMGADDEEAMKLAAAALTSTSALVHSDTERLDYALEHSKWLSETFFMSTWPFEETKTRMREKIDSELAKEGK